MQFSPRQQEVPVGGVPVLFPFKPYPSQRAMMAKVSSAESSAAEATSLSEQVIQALNQGANALLESPTGSGKSLALLCSSLAWLAQQRDVKAASAPCACVCHTHTDPPVPTPCQDGIKTEGSSVVQNGMETCNRESVRPSSAVDPVGREKGVADSKEKGVANPPIKSEMDEDFCKPKKRYRTPGGVANSESKRLRVKCEEGEGESAVPSSWKMELERETLSVSQQPSVMDTGLPISPLPPPSPSPLPCEVCQCAKPAGQRGSPSVPKVYFGTRTHQQISQITHELARTAYTSTPMCVMGSREHTCIHPDVSRSKRKNDECKKVLEEGKCSFYYRVAKKLGSQAQLLQHGVTSAWDMEDLVNLGKRVKACPYFAIRGIKEEAHIVFCPYNYLIDPLIRDQMLIELSGQVVVFDEAHNMEDAAREAASLSLSSSQLEELVKELTEILETYHGKLRSSFEFLAGIGVSVKKWMENTISSLPHNGFDQTCGIWSGPDFIPVLKTVGIIDATPAMIKSHLKAIMDAVNEQKRKAEEGEESEYVPSPSNVATALLKGLAMVLSYLYRQGEKFADDYRVSLMRTASTRPTDDGWRRRRRSRVMEKMWVYSLNFWCLNPSVAFSELSCAHSVILTSGTLSPLSSFSSELGMEFKVQLEATHVVPEIQTFIRSISCGPHGRALLANYQNSETYEFQDEVGAVVRQVCQVVPSGVLCFFSSYKMLHKLTQRWQVTGMWGSIEQRKVIVTEPTGSNKTEFEAAMRQFYAAVQGRDGDHVTGSLFLAVCRGKVSEGLDFSDHNARAVITVGIPFPSIKDKQVELKREYNNQHWRGRGLLTGSEWYDIQAFRAINQALGRCIRHREDWGALVLVDERFGKGLRYTRGLSKWIRRRLSHEKSFSAAMRDLASFSERMSLSSGAKENSTCAVESSATLSTSKLPPLSPSLPSLHPLTSSTPLTQPNGRVKWQTPFSSPQSLATPTTLTSVVSQQRTFRYPGGLQNSHPPASPATGEPVKRESLDDSVEITRVELASDPPILVESLPHTLPSPLLFSDPCATPTSAPDYAPSLPPPPGREPVTDGEVEEGGKDDDETPPLSPHPHIKVQEDKKEGVVKAATPLRRTKANTRLALRCGRDCKDSIIGPITCSSCGEAVTSSDVVAERVRLEERLGRVRDDSRLWRELGTEEAFLLPAALVRGREREDGVCNAVWDGNLGMCFGILECPSGHMVGVKVHTALNPALHLKDKAIFPVKRTSINYTIK